ncbi:hypothetical protein [Nocardiopsis halotolerans]|uniref:hypothetical protein n=1 Tax=Nocardiopsis halotolerans TaxID=124252 RepID=UPI0003482C3A|nr:hypothetical protein [Nocardiopsis halotolerans]
MASTTTARALGGALLLTLTLGACSGSSGGEPDGSLSPALLSEFEALRERARSDFEREVLDRAIEGGGITQEDYEEAFNRYTECAEAAGLRETYAKLPNGLYQLTEWEVDADPTDQEAYERATNAHMETSADCAEGTILLIESAYTLQLGNPEGIEDPRQAAISCLEDEGIIEPDSYTPDEFDADLEEVFADAPFDPSDEAASLCLYMAGFAIATE